MKQTRLILLSLATVLALGLAPATLHAQIYGGPGITGGAELAGRVVNSRDFRSTVINYINIVLSFMALAATVVIIIGGIMLIFSLGEDTARDKVKKMVIFVAIGLVIILLSQGAVKIFVDISRT